MYTLSRKVIIRKWGRAGTSVHFTFTVMVKRQQVLRIQMRTAHPFLIYSIWQIP